ncbi:hypothetical protein DFS34DRAFT_598810 [Phlyctochytrium arcticum]|nr:hypothetical protein DFS34DRAFT_598810 [Phlyctochytrium arcticum]
MDRKKLEWQLKISRKWYETPDQELVPEQLSDVSIEVYPEDKVAEPAAEGQANKKPRSSRTPAAIIPAHSAILANNSKYFGALFTNGMVQSQKYPLTECPTVVKINGYGVPTVQYFLGHIYNDQRISARRDDMTMEDFGQALQIADEYGAVPIFDHISYIMLGKYVQPELPVSNVIELLTIAYKYSRETSEVLRLGCIAYFSENRRKISAWNQWKGIEFREFLVRHGCRDLCLALALQGL